MIPFLNRFHGHNSLSFVYKNGKAIRSRFLTIKFTRNPNRQVSRVAVVVSKKVVKGAVKRNRIRRRVYESVREILPNIQESYDIVIIVLSSELLIADHKDIHGQIRQLLTQADIVK